MKNYRYIVQETGLIEFVESATVPTVPVNLEHSIVAGSITVYKTDEQILEDLKEEKYFKIDVRTGELISQGYPYAGKVFSLSQNAQINILALDKTRTELNYPVHYTTLDNKDTYDVIDETDMHNMYLAAFNTKKPHIDSGGTLKDTVRAATTEEEIELIIDNR